MASPRSSTNDATLELIEAAREVRLRAYAPYSNFLVGAAVRDEWGNIHAGCNVENAAYPQGMCAEAAALAVMVIAGSRACVEVAVVGAGTGLVTPCGGCRQRIREFAGGDVPIHVCDDDGRIRQTFTLDQLLPFSFGPEHLGQ